LKSLLLFKRNKYLKHSRLVTKVRIIIETHLFLHFSLFLCQRAKKVIGNVQTLKMTKNTKTLSPSLISTSKRKCWTPCKSRRQTEEQEYKQNLPLFKAVFIENYNVNKKILLCLISNVISISFYLKMKFSLFDIWLRISLRKIT